jgi:hypothetical protein
MIPETTTSDSEPVGEQEETRFWRPKPGKVNQPKQKQEKRSQRGEGSCCKSEETEVKSERNQEKGTD